MFLQVLLGQVLQVSLRKRHIAAHVNLLLVAGDLDGLAESADTTSDLDACSEELSKEVGIEDLVFDGFGAVDSEGSSSLLGLSLSLLGNTLGTHLSLLCGHH